MSRAQHVQFTDKGTPYLTDPHVALLAMPAVFCVLPAIQDNDGDGDTFRTFLQGFDASLGFEEYLGQPSPTPGAKLAKIAGQLCYMSFGPGSTPHSQSAAYLQHIKESGHGSVLEHANFSLLLWGISRDVTHELVRHRAGMSYSQVSQRYVDGKVLRFVERIEFQRDAALHAAFIERIDRAAHEYNQLAEQLQVTQAKQLAALAPRDRRKAVNQSARALLPNETEAPIIVTGNGRSWRHFLEMRASRFADSSIRRLALGIHRVLSEVEPDIFGDYTVTAVPEGYEGHELTTAWKKV